MKKRICTIALIISISTILTGCGGDSTVDSPASDAEGTTIAEVTGYASTVEAKDFGGETITFLTYKNTDVRASLLDIKADEQNGDVLNDAIFNRNQIIEEKFNVELAYEGDKECWDAANTLSTSVLSGDGVYDVSLLTSSNNFNAGINGLLLNMNELSSISLDKPWWNSQVAKDTEILGVNYFYMSDMNLDTWMQSYVVYFNKKLADEYQVGNLYDTVRDGTWTISRLDEITRRVYNDLNGNTLYDENDRYGLSS